MKNISRFVDYELFKETHSYLMNIPFIKNIIEENRMLKQKVSDLTDVIVMKEMNMLVKKNIVLTIIMLLLTAKPNTDTDPDVIIKRNSEVDDDVIL
jgi:hypothetical protein